ncbi:flavin reductase family protein [Halobacillus sp. A1]|uniref:flavin reductase family protein n=1 Tax=Halobacillus sp. A1 TaxID=2880262 RepID=UPI0020A66DD7|nr:flavin reductase family protein [Halobacillus sp. A1]MCP3031768.1 flavin reductase family protein [Halobacillus sp. A1]
MIIEEEWFKDHDMSKLVKGAVVPRPVAWVSTVSRGGIRNLAPFSFFTVASMDPITLCFSIGRVEREKDTLVNIRDTGDFVINIVSESLANQMHISSKSYGREEDEFFKAGTRGEESVRVTAPRAANAPISFECKLDKIIEVGSSDLILGKVVCYHIKDDLLIPGDKVDPYKLAPVGRMAGDYSFIREFYRLPNSNLPK